MDKLNVDNIKIYIKILFKCFDNPIAKIIHQIKFGLINIRRTSFPPLLDLSHTPQLLIDLLTACFISALMTIL